MVSVVTSYVLLTNGSQAEAGKHAERAHVPMKLKSGPCNVKFTSFLHVLEDSAFYFPPLKQAKAILGSRAIRSQEMGWIWPRGCRMLASVLSQGAGHV